MKIELYSVGGSIDGALSNANTRWSDRSGLFLRLRAEKGATAWGEASPLPGYSYETLEESRRVLESLELFSSAASSIDGIQQCVQSLPEALPSARFALETALLDLLSQECGKSVSEVIENNSIPFHRCALLPTCSQPARSLLAAARALLERGISTAKLKVGRDWEHELGCIRGIRSALPALTLRIDVNGAWSPAQAARNLSDLEGLGLEFVEQPVSPENMSQLTHSPVPLAADESLRNSAGISGLQALVETSVLVALVLKPTVLGGIFACLQHREWARRSGLHCIASHCFEGPVAMAAIAEFAMTLDSPMAAGVDSHDALSAFPAIPIPQLLTLNPQSHRPGLGVIPAL